MEVVVKRSAIAVWTALVLGYILGALDLIRGAGLLTLLVVWVVGLMAIVIVRNMTQRDEGRKP
jgi:hypothetical protein